VNLEHFAFGEELGAEPTPVGSDVTGRPLQTYGRNPSIIGRPPPDVLNFACRDYGNRIGGWRRLELLDEFPLPTTILLNTAIYDHAPYLVAAHRILGAGDRAGHGRATPERQSVLPEAEERRPVAESTAAILRHEGGPGRAGSAP
jgi:hypothetical protein